MVYQQTYNKIYNNCSDKASSCIVFAINNSKLIYTGHESMECNKYVGSKIYELCSKWQLNTTKIALDTCKCGSTREAVHVHTTCTQAHMKLPIKLQDLQCTGMQLHIDALWKKSFGCLREWKLRGVRVRIMCSHVKSVTCINK